MGFGRHSLSMDCFFKASFGENFTKKFSVLLQNGANLAPPLTLFLPVFRCSLVFFRYSCVVTPPPVLLFLFMFQHSSYFVVLPTSSLLLFHYSSYFIVLLFRCSSSYFVVPPILLLLLLLHCSFPCFIILHVSWFLNVLSLLLLHYSSMFRRPSYFI
jgi:hypothetical protein